MTQLDLKIARFPNLSLLDKKEAAEADMVWFDELVAGGIYHAPQLNWKGDLTFFSQPEEFIRSEKERKTLAESRLFFEDQGYEIKSTEIDEARNAEFMNVYRNTTLRRNRAIDFNAELIVRKNLASGVPVWLFGLYKDAQLESGLLVSQVKDEMRVMFGAKKRFDQIRGGIGGVLEMELLRFCFDRKITKISHGISTNPSGIMDAAGIFEFKSRYGFTAFPLGDWHTTFILNDKVALSDLVFVVATGPGLGLEILAKNELPQSSKYHTRLIKDTKIGTLADHMQQAQTILGLPA